jgi:branched-chain amino acid transport system substrate-binding protein
VKEIGRPGVAVAVIALALCVGSASVTEAQRPIRIGASASRTGVYAALGQKQLRGYQLCVQHANDRGGVLGRKLELVVEDDQSQGATAAAIYEKLITQDKVDLVLGQYGSPMTAPVANVTEKHRMPMVAPTIGTTSFFKGVSELAKKRGLQVVFAEAYPKGTTDFAAILTRVRATAPDALGAATYFDDAVAITRQMKELNLNPRMYAATIGPGQPEFYDQLGRSAEFVYGPSQWEPEFVTIRAGGLIPIARHYPGAREFVEAHSRAYPGADLSYQTAAGYAGCQVLTEAVRRTGSLDREKVRDAILKLDFNTIFGPFRVDGDGLQIAHKMVMFQWQDGKKVIVWPEELAPGKPRFPTPPWSQRP